jgi:hypothetical protein
MTVMKAAYPKWFSLCLSSLCSLCLCGEFSFSAAQPDKVTYSDHVLPVLRDKCLGCHNADKARGGLDMSSYGKLLEGGSSGEVVKAGDADASRMFLLASHKAEPKMPPQGGGLGAEQIATLKKWIDLGAPENSGSKVVVAKPKADIGVAANVRGRPEGPPPMPAAKLLQESIVRSARPNAVVALAASPWAPLAAVAAPKQVLLYHTDTLELLGVLPFPHGQPHVLKFSRNGQLLLAGGGRGGHSGKVVVWNVASGQVVTEVGDERDVVLAADISADQTQIALGGPGKVVRVYATQDGELVREIKKHTDWITALDYSPDGALLATADRSAGLYVWEAATGREHHTLRGHTASVTDVSWRNDSKVLASSAEDGTVRLWDIEGGKQIKSWNAHGGGAESVRFGHDNRLVSCGRDRLTKVWDGNGAQQKAFEAFTDVALRATFAHDGVEVLAGDWTGLVRAWTVSDGRRVGEVTTNPPDAAERLAMSRKMLADAEKSLTTKEAELTKATAARTAAQAAAQKANQELAPAQKAADDTAIVAKVVATALADAKPAAERATAAVPPAQATVTAREVKAKAFADAAAQVKDTAAKTPANVELQQAAAQAQQIASQADADMTAARKALADATTAAKTAAERLTTAQRAVELTTGPAKSTADALAAKQKAAKAASDAATAAKATVDRLTADIATTRATIERLKAATVASR